MCRNGRTGFVSVVLVKFGKFGEIVFGILLKLDLQKNRYYIYFLLIHTRKTVQSPLLQTLEMIGFQTEF